MVPVPLLVAELLGGNGLDNLGEGEFIIPESMIQAALGGLELPLPIAGVAVECRSGFFKVIVRLDLSAQGLAIKPQVEQMFDLERLRIDPLNQFILLKPRGGLIVREETLDRQRISPLARAVVQTVLHTPTLLKLVRDRFPRSVHYENGRLHINLAAVGLMESPLGRPIPLGHVELKILDFLTIRDVDIRREKVVIRFRFEKERLLEHLRQPAPKVEVEAEAEAERPAGPRLLPGSVEAPPRKRDRILGAVKGVRGLLRRP